MGSSSLIFSGSLRPMRLDDRVRARRGWQNPVNMSVGSPTDSIALYCDLRDQRVPQKELDRLMAQTVGSLEEKNMLLQEKNMLLQEKISQGLADKMRLQTNVCSLRAVLDTRSVIERCCEEYYKANRGSPGSRQSKWKSDTDRVGGFISQLVTTPQPLSHEHLPSAPSTLRPRPRTRAASPCPCSYARGHHMLICNAALQILKKPGDKSPKKDFEGLLLDRPEEVRMILSQAGFKGSSVTWSPNTLLEELLDLYSDLSALVHNSYLVGTLPFTGWCLGGPSASAAAEIIVAITALEATYPAMQDQYNFPLKVLILDRDYKHVLTWQQNDAKTGFDIVTVNPPVHVPDPNLIQSLSPASALAQSSEGTSSPNFLRRWWQSSWR